MTGSMQINSGATPYNAAMVRLREKHYILIDVDEKVSSLSEDLKLELARGFQKDCDIQGLHGEVILVWPNGVGSVSFYPSHISEIRDFLGGIARDRFVKLLEKTIWSLL